MEERVLIADTGTGSRRKPQVALFALATLNVAVVVLTQLVILTVIGPGGKTDAFMAATTLPQMLSGMVSIALTSVLVPLLSGELPARQAHDSWRFLRIVFAIAFPFALLLSLCASWWTPLLFPGFSGEDKYLSVLLARIQIFAMPFAAINAVAVALCYAQGRFLRAEAATFFGAAIALTLMSLMLPMYGIIAAAIISASIPLVQTIILLPLLGRPPSFHDEERTDLRGAWRRIRPLLMGNIYHRTDILVDRYLLSMGGAGDMTLFSLVQQLYGALAGIIGKVWGTTAIPALTGYHKTGNVLDFQRLYRRRLAALGLMSCGIYLTLIFCGKSISNLLIEQAIFSSRDTSTLWLLMTNMGGLLAFCSMGVVVSGAYYALGETRIPTYLSMVSFTFFVGIKYLAFKHYGAVGVALATSIYFALNLAMLALYLPILERQKHLRRDAQGTVVTCNDPPLV